ncbi:MAG TPA: aminotransferase class IV, partial [Caldilineaceae bacterium]|nr:aminotransferase class IV [Caldilineaceae bacterium]
MIEPRLYAVTASGPQRLPTPAGASNLLDLYHDVALGVYSVLRTFQHNKFLHLDDHLARTIASMRLLGWQETLDLPALRYTLHQVCSEYPADETRVRIDFLAAPAQHLGSDSRLLVGLIPFTPLPQSYYTEGVAVGFTPGLARPNPRAKTADFAVVRQRLAPSDSWYETLLVNEQGQILEGVSSNFYAVRAGTLFTAGAGVLEGITRHILLTLAQQALIPICLKPVSIDDIPHLDEAALSSSTRGLLPIVVIDDHVVGDGA